MRHRIRRTIEMIALALLALPPWEGGTAWAQNASLRGDYNVDVTRFCVVANPPVTFSPLDFSASGPVSVIEPIGISGTLHFNGDGTGTFIGQTMAVFPIGGAGFPVTRTGQSCTVTYTVNADGTYTLQEKCDLKFIGGPSDGQTGILDPITLDGRISLDGTVLLISDIVPTIETFTNLATLFTNQRICHSHGVATSKR